MLPVIPSSMKTWLFGIVWKFGICINKCKHNRTVYIYLPIHMPTYQLIYLSTYVSVCLSVYLPTYVPTYLPIYVSLSLGNLYFLLAWNYKAYCGIVSPVNHHSRAVTMWRPCNSDRNLCWLLHGIHQIYAHHLLYFGVMTGRELLNGGMKSGISVDTGNIGPLDVNSIHEYS